MDRGFPNFGGDVGKPSGEKSKTEIWACRRSVHVDEERKGATGWGEVVRWFKEGHIEFVDPLLLLCFCFSFPKTKFLGRIAIFSSSSFSSVFMSPA